MAQFALVLAALVSAAFFATVPVAETISQEADPACHFDVEATGPPAQLQLAVTARCLPEINRLEFDRSNRLAIRDVRTLDGARARQTGDGWATGGGGLSYSVDLAWRVAGGEASRDVALSADTLMAPLDAWLGMPEPTRFDAELQVRIVTPPNLYALHAMQPVDGADGQTSRLTASGLSFAGYSVFSSRPAVRIEVEGRGGAAVPIDVHVGDSTFALSEAALAEWVGYFSRLSAAYWQGFPVDRLLVAIIPSGPTDRVVFGRVRGGGGASMQIVAGRSVTEPTLYRRDWILTHELLHLAQPHLPRDGMWLMEGMATYIEPILRHNASLYSADQVWSEWLNGMPAGSLGLNTVGLQRTNPYWGGAVALLAINVALVEYGGDNANMADCLRAGLQTVGNATVRARTSAIKAACDQALGVSGLSNFAARYRSPAEFSLPELWRKLGISKSNDGVGYSNDVATAALRSAILAPPPGFVAPPLPHRLLSLN